MRQSFFNALFALLIGTASGHAQAPSGFSTFSKPPPATNAVNDSNEILNVTREFEPALKENARTGAYEQPEWTTHRRFSTTRVYLQRDPWEFGFEQWWRGRFFRNDSASHLLQEEFSLGLPYRTQLDIYENWSINSLGKIRHHD